MERDEETGLAYHAARHYAPWLGRWTSCDPAEFTDHINMYVFCRNSPTTLIDHDGQGSDKPEETEAALRKERGALDKLGNEQADLLLQKGQQQENVSIRKSNVELAQHDLDAAQNRQATRGEKKALLEGTGTRTEKKALELAQRKLDQAKAGLEKTIERLETVETQITTSKKAIEKLVKKAGKIGANVNAAPGDSQVTAQDLADVDKDVLTEKIAAKEAEAPGGKKNGGNGGGGGRKGGPSERWSGGAVAKGRALAVRGSGALSVATMPVDAIRAINAIRYEHAIREQLEYRDEIGTYSLMIQRNGIFYKDNYYKRYSTGNLAEMGLDLEISKSEYKQLVEEKKGNDS